VKLQAFSDMNGVLRRLEGTASSNFSADLSIAVVAVDAMPQNSAEILTRHEQTMWSGYQLTKRKNEFFAGRVAAKQAFAEYSRRYWQNTLSAWEIEVKNASTGRPFMAWHGVDKTGSLPELSISHSGNYAVAMIAEKPCGIDIQQKSDRLIRLQEKFICPTEITIFDNEGATCSSLLERLNILWTAKEAIKKGLSHGQMPGFLDLIAIRCKMVDDDLCYITVQCEKGDDSSMTLFVCVASFSSEYCLACTIAPDECSHA
jgi:holo-[acyl-carrier protein] synthase